MVLNVHRNHKAYEGRGEGRGGGVWRWVKREIIYLSLHCHLQNDSCIKMGSDESHFNVSVGSDGQSRKTVSTNHNLFEEKGRAEAVSNRGPSAYQPNALPLGQTGSPAGLHALVCYTVSVARACASWSSEMGTRGRRSWDKVEECFGSEWEAAVCVSEL